MVSDVAWLSSDTCVSLVVPVGSRGLLPYYLKLETQVTAIAQGDLLLHFFGISRVPTYRTRVLASCMH